MRSASVFVSLIGCLLFIPDAARSQDPAKLEFEVATVKPAAPFTGRGAPRGGPGTANPERVNYTYVSMKNLLMSAYNVPINRVIGPAWIDSERYDIAAKVPPGATKEQVNVMLQNLLADRFKLVVRREIRELPLYELVVGKSGPRLKTYTEDPNPPKPESGKPFATDKDGNPIPRPGGSIMSMSQGIRQVVASKQSIGGTSGLVATLEAELGRPVLDKTGLTGYFDYILEFRPQGPNAAPSGQQIPEPNDSDALDILVAVQEQLGLRLEAKKGPIEVVVVVSGEKSPTEN